jgi:hypothetical protein
MLIVAMIAGLSVALVIVLAFLHGRNSSAERGEVRDHKTASLTASTEQHIPLH